MKSSLLDLPMPITSPRLLLTPPQLGDGVELNEEIEVLRKSYNILIGATGYHHMIWEVPCLETGYWIRTQYSGKGYMTEAVNAITQYATKQLKMKRVAITCDIDISEFKYRSLVCLAMSCEKRLQNTDKYILMYE